MKEQDAKIEQLRDMNEMLRSQLRGDLKDALRSFGNGPDRQAKSNARCKMATMEEEGREEEEDQDPVYKRIAEHFARDGKGNFKLHVRELAMELTDIASEAYEIGHLANGTRQVQLHVAPGPTSHMAAEFRNGHGYS